MNRLQEIEARKKEIRTLLESGAECDLDALEKELRDLDAEKTKIEKRNALAASINAGTTETRTIEKPEDKPQAAIPAEPRSNKGLRVFKNFGEQLRTVKRAAFGDIDSRLQQLNAEARANGMNEGIGSEGGFAVQTDFGGMMMESAAKAGDILSRVDSFNISDNANSVKWVDIDESSVATTVFGGVQAYWAAEAATVNAKKLVLAEKELKLEKLMGIAYATYELENDSNFISDLYTRAFTLAIQRELEAAIVSGTGVGKPLGFLTGTGKVSVAKENGQAADTVIWENISKMYNRALEKTKCVWLVNPDVHEQLDFLTFPVGVGGVPVYLQASMEGSVDMLKGRPVIDSDHCSAIGDQGDINFVDLSKYLMIYKGGMLAETSIHVQFLAAENCFRFIFRANGMPKKNNTLTIKNSSNARSSFVTLDAR